MNHKIWMMLALTLSATGAQAADTYAGVEFLMADYQESGMSDSLSPKAIAVKYGIQADQNLGVEFRLGTGINEGKGSNMTIDTGLGSVVASDVTVNLDLLLGIYGKATLPMTDVLQVYGIAGITSVETTADVTIAGFKGSANSTGTEFSYGAGFAFKPNDKTTLTTEYMMMVDNGDVQITSLNLGFAMKF